MVTTAHRPIAATPPPGPHGPRRRAAASSRRRRVGRRLLRFALVLLLLLVVVLAGTGWYVSGEIIAGLRVEPPRPATYDTEVLAVDDQSISLRQPAAEVLEADAPAVLGLGWDAGYAQLGPRESFEGGVEVRRLTLLDGSPPPLGPEVADVDSFAFPSDPARAGLAFEVVTYPGPLGPLEAWSFPGEGTLWLIGVHGVGADRHDLLRFVVATRDLNVPTLVIRYRNDPDAPATDGSLILAGQDEWEDVAAAIAYAQEQGATGVVLAGVSMGGALSLAAALHDDAHLVRGLILEAPTADLRQIVALRSGEALPVGGVLGDAILALGRGVTSLRTGIDFDAVDYVGRADELDVPVLLFHGTADPTVPFEVGQALADARPDLVEFQPVAGGEHVRAWNLDPSGYAVRIRTFVAGLDLDREAAAR